MTGYAIEWDCGNPECKCKNCQCKPCNCTISNPCDDGCLSGKQKDEKMDDVRGGM